MRENRLTRSGTELLLLLCVAGIGAGCGSHRERIFAYRLPNYPLAKRAPAAAVARNHPPTVSQLRDRRARTRSRRLTSDTNYYRFARRGYYRRAQRAGMERRDGPSQRTPYRRAQPWGAGDRRTRPRDLNHISLAQLERIPGLTPAIAARIIAARPFRSKRTLLLRGYLSRTAYNHAKSYLVVHRADRKRGQRRRR